MYFVIKSDKYLNKVSHMLKSAYGNTRDALAKVAKIGHNTDNETKKITDHLDASIAINFYFLYF